MVPCDEVRALFHDNFPSKLFLKQFKAAGTESVYDATFQKQGSKTQRDVMADESAETHCECAAMDCA